MITKGNVKKHELIGLDVRVLRSNPDLTDLEGRVVDETRNLLTIETHKGERKVPKEGSVFEFAIPEGRVVIEGDSLLFRPEDRIKRAR
jgi:ribonuclease P protein subunit POP4